MILVHRGIQDPHCFPCNLKAFSVVEKAVDFTCALLLPCSSLLPSLYTYDMTTVAFWCRILWRNHANHCLLLVSSILRGTWVCGRVANMLQRKTHCGQFRIRHRIYIISPFSSICDLWGGHFASCAVTIANLSKGGSMCQKEDRCSCWIQNVCYSMNHSRQKLLIRLKAGGNIAMK